MTEPIQVEGLAQFSRDLKKLSSDLPKALRLALNSAADLVTDQARPKVPTLTGRARKSVKSRSTRTAVRVVGGGNRAPYFPWLSFGGQIGKRSGRAVGRRGDRPYVKDGRYIYDVYFKLKRSGEFQEVLTAALLDVARQAGIEVE